MLRKYMVITTTSTQNLVGMFFSLIIPLVISTTIWFLLSVTPFCCGEYGAVNSLHIPCSSQWSLSSTKRNSLPRLVHRIFSCFSVITLKLLKFSNVCDLYLMKYKQLYLVQSLVTRSKYNLPPNDLIYIGPHKFTCTSSSGVLTWDGFSLGKECLACFPRTHPSHTPAYAILGKPFTRFIWLSAYSPLKCKWSYLLCHKTKIFRLLVTMFAQQPLSISNKNKWCPIMVTLGTCIPDFSSLIKYISFSNNKV